MAQVSIIVPVYQVEQYLRQCIDSILAQSFTDFELILVDDGSKDQSGAICDEYAEQDGRVCVIHTENKGLAAARNTGLDRVTGEYFAFVDSDDWIGPTMVECLYHSILRENGDIAACNFQYSFDCDPAKNFSTSIQREVVPAAEIFYYRKNDRSFGFWTVAWNKLYKSEVFGKCRFPVGKYHEDEFWANEIYQMDIRIVTVPDCLYFYRQRAGSIMSKTSLARNMDILQALGERIAVYLRDEQYSDQAYRVLLYSLEYLQKSKGLIANQEDKARFGQAEKQIKDIVQQLKKKKLAVLQKASLAMIGMNPCLVFTVAIPFRGFLEKFL